jgi:hypothetical protein
MIIAACNALHFQLLARSPVPFMTMAPSIENRAPIAFDGTVYKQQRTRARQLPSRRCDLMARMAVTVRG